jgi:hypothetical protein
MTRQDWNPELLLLNTLVEKLDEICALYEAQGEPQEMHEAIQEAQTLIKGIDRSPEEGS